MTLEEIQKLWDVDCIIDKTELGDAALKIPQLSSKYLKLLSRERLSYQALLGKQKQLRLDKQEFFLYGPFQGDERGWKLPPSGKVLKGDVPAYIDADPDVCKLQLQIEYQKEKVDFLFSIIKSINDRTWYIKNNIEWMRFTNGG
jgi:hypothetical protein